MSSEENSDREVIIRVKEKSEDDFEKNITYISAGTLVLSLTFIEKIVTIKGSQLIWALITSWILLALTLLLNLISHQVSSWYHDKTLDECDKKDDKVENNVLRRNSKMRNFNTTTIGFLILGIFFLILYCSKNAIKMSNEKDNLETQIPNNNDSNDLIKGRTITMPITVPEPISQTSNTPATVPPPASDSLNSSNTK